MAEVEFRVGKITPLEKTTAEGFYKNIQQLLRGAEIEYANVLSELQQYLKTPQLTVNQSFVMTMRVCSSANLQIAISVNLPAVWVNHRHEQHHSLYCRAMSLIFAAIVYQ